MGRRRNRKGIGRKKSGSEKVDGSVEDGSENWMGEEKDIPIGVYSRIAYPLIQATNSLGNENTWSDEDSEEESFELKVRPRFVFARSLCAICLEKSQVFCEECRMVSYCSPTHRSQGLAKHRDLCEHLREIRGAFASMPKLDAEGYRGYRLRLLANLESRVGRALKLWEREIILYPPVCRVCREFCDRSICCTRCAMESFCADHAAEHEKWCPEFRVFQRCLLFQERYGCVEPKIPRVREPIPLLSESAFDRLMHRIYAAPASASAYYRQMDCYTYSVLSHLCTIPLTALYSMQISCPEWRNNAEWSIDLIGAEFQFEGINLHVWEKLFLHFLPNLKTLRLRLIGPELRLPTGVPARFFSKVKLCSTCKSSGRSVAVTFHAETLYHEVVRERAKQPDLVCAFNPGLYRKTGYAGRDTWIDTIREFPEISAPILITSYTEDEIHWEIDRLESLIDLEIVAKPTRNPFSSIKPDRNFVSDDTVPLIYKNYYMTVLKGKS